MTKKQLEFEAVFCIDFVRLVYSCYNVRFIPVTELFCICVFSDVEQMAFDWLTRNIYFVDHVSDRIFVCNFNGSVCVTLIESELHNPKAIAADPIAG